MRTFREVHAALRHENKKQYIFLAGCFFISTLLITAYTTMMRSPMIMNVLPEGGDSRKQMQMIFVLAVIGCALFIIYASGLFLRQKSRETGVLLSLGTTRHQIRIQLMKEMSFLTSASCIGGILLGGPLSFGIWQFFRLILVDTDEMKFAFSAEAYGVAFAFALIMILFFLFLIERFVRRTNIIDIVNESRKSEPIKNVPQWYGWAGILMMIGGGILGLYVPDLTADIFHWYPPGILSALFYLPAFIGLYMILLHTVVNGWMKGKNRYKHIVTNSMMKFEGRQTVRNMLVITVLVAGAYFAAFYTPIVGVGGMLGIENQKSDYGFCYRADQPLPTEQDVYTIAQEEGVKITHYASQQAAILGVDGNLIHSDTSSMGTIDSYEYLACVKDATFLSESAYNALTGENIDLAPGTVTTVFLDDGTMGLWTSNETKIITNVVTKETLQVTSVDLGLHNSMLYTYKVLDDADYEKITQGLTPEWQEVQVLFDVENVESTYPFAKRLFNKIVDSSGPEVEVIRSWSMVSKMRMEEAGEKYELDSLGINYGERDSSHFRFNWKYMPKFRILDQADFIKTGAVYLLLFILIAIICFAAVIVIAYTRSLTIGMNNKQVFDDLRHLGANNAYLFKTVKEQIAKIFFTPVLTGTAVMLLFMLAMLLGNDGRIMASEMAGYGVCLAVAAGGSVLFYGVYRYSLNKVCGMLGIRARNKIKKH